PADRIVQRRRRGPVMGPLLHGKVSGGSDRRSTGVVVELARRTDRSAMRQRVTDRSGKPASEEVRRVRTCSEEPDPASSLAFARVKRGHAQMSFQLHGERSMGGIPAGRGCTCKASRTFVRSGLSGYATYADRWWW